MKRTHGLVLAILVIVAACPTLSLAENGERSGLQLDIGLGFTKGIDAEEVLELGTIDQSAGATPRFGLTYRLPLADNFYLNPTFNIGFYNSEIDFGGMEISAGGQTYHLQKIEWKTTQINFGVNPIYYFMPPTAKFRFYGGLGIKLNINSFGDSEWTLQETTASQETDGKTSIALGPMIGFDYQINPNMALPFWIQYDLLFAEDMTNVLMVMTGWTFLF